MSDFGGVLDVGYSGDKTRAAATRYLQRTGNADLLPILGLAEDPESSAMRKAKALADMGARASPKPPAEPEADQPPPGCCGLCNNPLPKNGVCRKTQRCREAAAKKETAK